MSALVQKTAAFDFDKAVADTRRDFPEVAQHTAFVDLDDPDALIQIVLWVTGLSRKSVDLLQERGSIERMTPESHGFSAKDPNSEARIVAVHTKASETLAMFRSQPGKQAIYVFLHELGHLVAPIENQSSNKDEHSADSFALMRGLQLGLFTVDDVKHAADTRIASFLNGHDLEHLTTASLDWIAVNPEDTNFISLTPQQTAAVARAHALALGNTAEDEQSFATVHVTEGDKPSWNEKMVRLSALAITAPAESSVFYLAARILNRAFAEGKVDENFSMFGMQPGYWDGVRNIIARKTEALEDAGIRTMLEKTAPAAPSSRPQIPDSKRPGSGNKPGLSG